MTGETTPEEGVMKKMTVVAETHQEVGSVDEYREKVRMAGGGRPKVKASMSEVAQAPKTPTIGEKFAGR